MDKFRHKLPKEELKKFGRDINKKLVASDYKNGRVDDPTSITVKQEKKVKQYVKDFFDRAVEKFREHEKKKAERAARHAARRGSSGPDPNLAGPSIETASKEVVEEDDEAVMMSEVEDLVSSPGSSLDRKRKREEDDDAESPGQLTPSETPSAKRLKEDEADAPSPPPPPPPPPAGVADTPMTEEERSMREQEEALMRENEEAQRLEDEAEATKLQNEGEGEKAVLGRPHDEAATRDAKLEHPRLNEQLNEQHFQTNNGLGAYEAGSDVDPDGPGSAAEGSSSMGHEKSRKQEVLSH